MKALKRWSLFLLIGYPIQLMVFVVYPFLWLYWRLFVYEKPTHDIIVAHEVHPETGIQRDSFGLLDNVDDHGAFSMYGAINRFSLEILTDGKGNLIRKKLGLDTFNRWQVSGDVVISWLFAYTAPNITIKPSETLQSIALKYLLNLGVLSKDDKNNEDVSSRCNNFGVNYCPDSDAYGIGQPAAGPQFYTSSALFALASQRSYFFKLIFWTHWLLMGGWYWCWAPVLYTKAEPLHYVRDMTMKALYVHKYVFGDAWWIRKPMMLITYDLSNYRNDLWFAMRGISPSYGLPDSMDSFFSQQPDCTSRLSDRMNGYLGPAIKALAEQAKGLK